MLFFIKWSIIVGAIERHSIDCLSGFSEYCFLCFKLEWWRINTLSSQCDHVEEMPWLLSPSNAGVWFNIKWYGIRTDICLSQQITCIGPFMCEWLTNSAETSGVYTKFSGRLSEEPFPWLIQKFPCILIFKTGQPGCQLNLSEGQIRLDLTSGRPLV